MSKLSHREFKELDKLYKKSGFTKLSQQEQRRLERLEALSQDNKKGVEKEKWVNDRKSKKKHITPKSEAQQLSLESFGYNKVTVCSGATASGKSAVALWWSANQIVDGYYDKICICRPNTALGNHSNGYRQGSLLEKLYGWHLPQIEYLSDVFGREVVDIQLADPKGYVQIVDFEALRGSTFGRNEKERTILVVDESQLLTSHEVDCIMTRIGEHCKVILIGDPSPHQRDRKDDSGLVYLEQLVNQYDIPDVGFVKYRIKDICRSDFVFDYVVAMQRYRNLDID